MAKFVRTMAGYDLKRTEDGVSGREIYVRADDIASAVDESALPQVGITLMVDHDDRQIAKCVCRDISDSFPSGSDKSSIVRTFTFNTSKKGSSPGATIPDTGQTAISTGTEIVSTDGGESYWVGQGVKIDKVKSAKLTFTGTIAVPMEVRYDAFDAYMEKQVLVAAGRVNGSKMNRDGMRSFPIGSILFLGISGGTKTDKAGVVKWAFNLNFAFRIIPGLVDTATPVGPWNYSWNAKSKPAGWDIVSTDAAGNIGLTGTGVSYRHSDLNKLFIV